MVALLAKVVLVVMIVRLNGAPSKFTIVAAVMKRSRPC
jgi:hypothetical protein